MELGRDRAPGAPGSRPAAPTSHDLGTMSQVTLPRAGAPAAAPGCCSTACSQRSGAARADADARGAAALAGGPGRPRRTFRLPRQRGERRRVQLSMPVPAPELWSPGATRSSTGAASSCATAARSSRSTAAHVGLRSVTVKRGMLYLNNRRIKLRGRVDPRGHARPRRRAHRRGHGPIVRDLKDARRERHPRPLPAQRPACSTRSTGPGSWSGTRRRSGSATAGPTSSGARSSAGALDDGGAHGDRRRAATRPCITHSVANELSFTPDGKPARESTSTARSELAARPRPDRCRSRSTSTAAPATPSSSPTALRLLGINQYFGWYRWVPNFDDLGRSSTRCATSTRSRRW